MTANGVLSPVICQHEERRTLIIYVLYGEAPQWGPTPSPFIKTRLLTEKVALFLYLPNCCKCAVFEIWRDCKPDSFFRLFKDIKCICNPFRAFLQTEKTWFPNPFIWFRQQVKSLPFLPEAFGLEPSRTDKCREFPPGTIVKLLGSPCTSGYKQCINQFFPSGKGRTN